MVESDGVLPNNNQTHKKIKYLILGCGSIGYNVLEELKEDDENVLVIDVNEKRVEDLRDHRHQAMVGDMTDPGLLAKIPEPEMVFILAADKDANLAAVQNIKGAYPQTHVIARAVDLFSADQLVDHGADVVLYPQQVVAKSAVNHMNNLVASRNAQKLFSLLSSWSGTLGIITHKNPDPDAISSAMALSAIAANASGGKLATRILYEGNIGHQENRAFVNLLEIKMERLTPEILGECNYLALVDCVAPGMNNDLPLDTPINIVIFQRNLSPQDLHNAAYLLPLSDRSLLEVIMAPSVSQETLDVLGHAIVNREVRHGYLFSNVGYVRNRDAIPQAADMLLNLEGVSTAMVYGITDTSITLSARNKDIRLHVGDVMKEAFSPIPGASAGGHATMAALSIPLNAFSLVKNKDELLNMIIDPVLSNFMRIVGISEAEGALLL